MKRNRISKKIDAFTVFYEDWWSRIILENLRATSVYLVEE
jgi:hypothetical protein